ncbi:MAG: hypothetical protein M0Z36_05475 [Thermaerobacter sp.]|nr:hypothetical protein [Thermaerobacter sp.]
MPLNADYTNGFIAGQAWSGPTRSERARATQRALCTCPHCGLMWEHYETSDAQADLRAMRQQWGNPSHIWACSGCGQYSTVDQYQNHRVALSLAETQARDPAYFAGRGR